MSYLAKIKAAVAEKYKGLELTLDSYPRYAQGRSGKWYELTAKMNGKDVGYLRYKKKPGGFSVIEVFVEAAYRRQGIATKMYDYVEANYGKLFKSKDQTDDGKAFRKSYTSKINAAVAKYSVQRFIKKVTPLLKDLQTPQGAYWACQEVVGVLKPILTRLGIKATVGSAELKFPKNADWAEEPGKYVGHYFLVIDNKVVDFTLRQFDPDSPFPFVALKSNPYVQKTYNNPKWAIDVSNFGGGSSWEDHLKEKLDEIFFGGEK